MRRVSLLEDRQLDSNDSGESFFFNLNVFMYSLSNPVSVLPLLTVSPHANFSPIPPYPSLLSAPL